MEFFDDLRGSLDVPMSLDYFRWFMVIGLNPELESHTPAWTARSQYTPAHTKRHTWDHTYLPWFGLSLCSLLWSSIFTPYFVPGWARHCCTVRILPDCVISLCSTRQVKYSSSLNNVHITFTSVHVCLYITRPSLWYSHHIHNISPHIHLYIHHIHITFS